MYQLTERWQAFLEFSAGPRDEVQKFFAPGRVNLIGEHLDYNGGFVFPAALTLGVWAWVRPRTDGQLRFFSMDFPAIVEANVADIHYDAGNDYANYPLGVIAALQQEEGRLFSGGDFFYFSNLPNGAGLSSSAALEVVTGCAVRTLMNSRLTNEQIAVLSQRAENEFVGVNCGIMDQFSVAMGKADHAILLNCQTLAYEWVPIRLGGYRLVITNTNQRRGLADSKYNERRNECDEALAHVRTLDDRFGQLADIPVAMWPEVASRLANYPTLYKRARHVVFENQRTQEAVAVLRNGDLPAFGQLLNASHISLRDDYEVTGEALDALAQAAWDAPGCIGSRMTGAGFGGCTVSIVEADQLELFKQQVEQAYRAATGLVPTFYISQIGDGAHALAREDDLQ